MPPEDNEDYIDLDNEAEDEVVDPSEMTAEEKAIARGDYINGEPDNDEEKEEVQEETDEEETDEVDEDGNTPSGSEGDSESDDGNEDGDNAADEPRIPKSRLDQVIAQREEAKELAARLAEREDRLLKLLEAQQEPKKEEAKQPAFDIDAKEAEALDAMLEADVAKYTQIRHEINAHILEQARSSASTMETTATTAAKAEARAIEEENRFNDAVNVYSTKYPFLNSGDENFNEEALVAIDKLFTKFVGAGDSKTVALTEAVNLIAPRYAPEAEDDAVAKAKATRRSKAVKKAAKAMGQTPPETKGRSTQKVEEFSYENLATMSEKEWKDLPASIKKKLRGD